MTIDDEDSSAMIVGTEIIGAMDEEFHDSPDRVIAIVGATYLDSVLGELLRAVFISEKKPVDDLNTHGPLGSYGSRYQHAYYLGLIDERERDDLKTIARIRNAFAHKYDVRSFDHDEPTKLITKLHIGKELDAIVEGLASRTNDPAEKQRLREIGSSGRRKFQDTVRSSFVVLLQKLHVVVRSSQATQRGLQ